MSMCRHPILMEQRNLQQAQQLDKCNGSYFYTMSLDPDTVRHPYTHMNMSYRTNSYFCRSLNEIIFF